MIRLIHTELLKLRTTRSVWAILAAALLIVLAGVIPIAAATSFGPSDNPVRESLSLAGPAQTFALLLGVLAITTEFRHGTITPALLITPTRTPLLLAKIITLAAVGALLGLVAFGTATGIALPILSARHLGHLPAHAIVDVVTGGAITTGLCAALGVALGALIRNQVGAIVAVLCLLYVLEPLLSIAPAIGHTVQLYGLGGLASGGAGTTAFPSTSHLLAQTPATLMLAGYALAAVLAAVFLIRHADIGA
jgi:ABC-2 type transport system permease protein